MNPFMHQRGHCQRDTEGERETERDLDKHLAPFYGKSKTVVCACGKAKMKLQEDANIDIDQN